MFLRHEARQTEFFVILGHFLPFYSTSKPKNQNFENLKKAPGDIIILHKCTNNHDHDHMLYCSSDMAHDGCKFYFSFWAIFCPKSQKLKKMEKIPGDIINLHKCTKNHDHMPYCT